MSKTYPFISYNPPIYADDEQLKKSLDFYDFMDQRRSCRDFSDAPISREVIENIIKTASSAPSGAHKQPWTFVAVNNPKVKREIRLAAEKEEQEFYDHRVTPEWLEDLKPIGTDPNKPFLETAPWLIAVFKKTYNEGPKGKSKNYYVQESVGIACGFLIAAIHHAGLVALTHTPSPMNFLSEILKRPDNEKPFLLLPVGLPAKDARVPDLKRKPLEEMAKFI